MIDRRTLVCLAAFAALAIAAATAAAEEAACLFPGKNLDGWKWFCVDDKTPVEDVWSVKDGVLVCQGQPFGYLYVDDEFQDFRLTLKWRWAPGKEPGNSGVLLRITGEPKWLPKCVEAQLKSGSAGDVWAFRGAAVDGPEDRQREVRGHAELGDFDGVARAVAAENEPGQWNEYDILVKGEKMTLTINSKVVNEVAGLDQVAGPIGLQSEGAEIHFKDVKLKPLK